MPDSRALIPASGIPLLYFGFAHACLAAALGILVVNPSLPGGFFLHPRMAAVVHLVTLGWISGSILGAFYIVGPLALRMPFRPGWRDRAAFVSFAVGVIGMVTQFWHGDYRAMAAFAVLVVAAMIHVGTRAGLGLSHGAAPWGVKLHVALAFVNVAAASTLGLILGLNRTYGWFSWPPFGAAYAHLHLAVVGWATMMFVGLAYRLIPMIVPAAMPSAASIAASAWLMQSGVVLLAIALVRGSSWTSVGAALILAGLVSFVVHVRSVLSHRLPPPAALPRPDWATWQTHMALLWLVVAAVVGMFLSLPGTGERVLTWGWIYGTAGLIGFLAQVIVGMQGRLLPMHAWYGAFEAGGHDPPARPVHALASQALARAIFFSWTMGVPALAFGLARASSVVTRSASVMLLVGVVLGAVQSVRITIVARSSKVD
jgi:hypothetical protein